MISILKYSPLVKFKIHGQKRTRADIIIQPSSPLIPPPQPLAHFRRSFKRTFRRTFKRTFIIFFWIQRSQSPNNPSYQGLKFPSSNNPMLWSSKALKPFYSSQNPLNLGLTLKQLLFVEIFFMRALRRQLGHAGWWTAASSSRRAGAEPVRPATTTTRQQCVCSLVMSQS